MSAGAAFVSAALLRGHGALGVCGDPGEGTWGATCAEGDVGGPGGASWSGTGGKRQRWGSWAATPWRRAGSPAPLLDGGDEGEKGAEREGEEPAGGAANGRGLRCGVRGVPAVVLPSSLCPNVGAKAVALRGCGVCVLPAGPQPWGGKRDGRNERQSRSGAGSRAAGIAWNARSSPQRRAERLCAELRGFQPTERGTAGPQRGSGWQGAAGPWSPEQRQEAARSREAFSLGCG